MAGVLDSVYLGKIATEFNFDNNIFIRAATESKKWGMGQSTLLQASGSSTSAIERSR